MSRVVYGSDDRLFGRIEKTQLSQSKPFGRFLDAGTGTHSLRWMASLMIDHEDGDDGEDNNDDATTTTTNTKSNDANSNTNTNTNNKLLRIEHYTAITADEKMRSNVLKEAQALGIAEKGDIIIGNWEDTNTSTNPNDNGDNGKGELCHGLQYDTILADYLVGAMDGFSPYYQDQIFPRLARHLKPGGLLHVVGLNPIPDKPQFENGDASDAAILCKVTKLRDACILLAGHRCYREYPVEWIERHIEQAGMEVLQSSRFPILYSHAAIVRQLNVARSKLSLFSSRALAKEMGEAIDALEEESKVLTEKSPTGRLKLGFDYVVTARMPMEGEEL